MSIVIHRENKAVYSKKRKDRMIIGVICLFIGEWCITCGPVLILKRYSEHSYTMSDKNEEIEKNVSDQTGVERQRKEVNVEDYPKSVSIGQILKDLEFPADKQKIIQHVQKSSIDNASSSMIGNMFLTATCTYTKIKGAYRYETYLADCRR